MAIIWMEKEDYVRLNGVAYVLNCGTHTHARGVILFFREWSVFAASKSRIMLLVIVLVLKSMDMSKELIMHGWMPIQDSAHNIAILDRHWEGISNEDDTIQCTLERLEVKIKCFNILHCSCKRGIDVVADYHGLRYNMKIVWIFKLVNQQISWYRIKVLDPSSGHCVNFLAPNFERMNYSFLYSF